MDFSMYQPELPFGSGFVAKFYAAEVEKPKKVKPKKKPKRKPMKFKQVRNFIKKAQCQLLKKQLWLGDICKHTGQPPSKIKQATKDCDLLIDGCLDWHDDEEVRLYLIDWQPQIKSGKLSMVAMEKDTMRKRSQIRKIAIDNDLAYKKEEVIEYFTTPLGPWNRPLGHAVKG